MRRRHRRRRSREYNGLGYSGTNSGGNLLIVNSIFRHNRAGIVPNSGCYELCYPERETTIVGNIVYDNNQPDTPAIDVALLAQGNGILVAGGRHNDIERNLVYDHERTGIGLVPFPEEDANDSAHLRASDPASHDAVRRDPTTRTDPRRPASRLLWPPTDNQVIGNVVEGSGLADLASATSMPARVTAADARQLLLRQHLHDVGAGRPRGAGAVHGRRHGGDPSRGRARPRSR